jgi:hypothetical protein
MTTTTVGTASSTTKPSRSAAGNPRRNCMAIIRQVDGIVTVQQLRDALIPFHPDMAIGDVFCEGICITHRADGDGEEYLEVT